ncbi:MAG: TrkA family potassium uptake protein [Chloroflexi bacterium]|nr:TrkA family potassium uptake protein [Chloroflexota bacterium]
MLTSPRRRLVRAQLRDAFVLLREFRFSLLLFALLVGIGTFCFWQWYEAPGDGARLTPSRALYAAFSLIFFQTGNVPYPDNLWIDTLYYLMPIIGLGIIGDGLARFGVQIFNKEMRKEEWNVSLASTYANHVIVCGAGHVGYRVIEQLAQMGEEVVVVESNRANRFTERVRDRLHFPLIVADATRTDTLQQAGVERARAVIPCTSNDMINLEIALNARELNPQVRIVMRMFDADLARKLNNGFGLGAVFSTAALAAPAIAAAVREHDIRQALYVDDTLVALAPVDIQPGSLLAGQTVAQVEQALDVNLVLHRRNGAVDYRPDHGITLQTGDHIIVFGTLDGLNRARRRNGGHEHQ